MPIDERLSRPMTQPSMEELQAAAASVQSWAFEHFESLPERSIGETATPSSPFMSALQGLPDETPTPFEKLFEEFQTHIQPFAFRTYHPRFLAFVPSASTLPAMIGDWLSAACNFFAGVWLEGSGPAQIESTVLDWFGAWIGMPDSTMGLLTTGGSEANLTALVVARQNVPFEDRERAVLYVADQRHSSIDRAAKVMGIAPNRIRAVRCDHEFRMRGEALQDAIRSDRDAGLLPWAVVANAGATNTGTVDALPEIADVCEREGLWLHIDGAYGWAGVLTEIGQRELAGIDRADSLTLDPHKWLAQTYDVGCVLVRDGKRLTETFATRPDYLQDVEPDDGEINFADRGIALTRRFRALKIWLSVKMLGLSWFREMVQRGFDLAEYAEMRLRDAGCFEILCPRRLSIVCFRYLPADGRSLEQANIERLQILTDSGRGFLSSTRLNGQFALRMCFVNWRTTTTDIDEIIGILRG